MVKVQYRGASIWLCVLVALLGSLSCPAQAEGITQAIKRIIGLGKESQKPGGLTPHGNAPDAPIHFPKDAPLYLPKDAPPPTEQQAAPSAATEVPLLPEWFREIDIEKKGEIGREEFITHRLKTFDTLDTKHEGKLTLKEFLKFFGLPKSYVLNTNSDGLIDRIEAESAAGAEFDQYDLDRNGRINEAEVRLVMLLALNQGIAEVLRHQDTQPGTSGRATTSSTQQKVDDDTFRKFISTQQKVDDAFRKFIPNVGGLDAPLYLPKDAPPPTEQQAAPSAATEVPLLPEWFREIDIEKKGEIGREEFITHRLKTFDTLDTKHEGKLTLKEFLKFFGLPKSYVLNTNSDGLIDRIEAESVAGAEFDQYDIDRKGRVNEAEVRLVMLRALNQGIAEVRRHQDTQPGTSGRTTTSSTQQNVDFDTFWKFIPNIGGLIGLIWLIRWLIRKIKGNTSPQESSHLVEGSPESVASDPQRATPPISATGQDVPETVSWRERLERLPTDGSITINGLVVWKLQAKDGRIYYSGEREFSSIEDVLSHYKPPVSEAI